MHCLDQSCANDEEGTRKKREKDPISSRALSSLVILGELFGVVISRIDVVVKHSGFYP